ncbi:MAG: hypothetical protein HY063_07815 [Bacteroidetes bacterium]|nr:hypothetical protein [Bacteroidota bacterium]
MLRKISPITISFAAIFVALAGLFFSSCGGSKEENPELKDFEQTTDTVSSQVRVDFDLIRVNIPKPAELTSKLSAAKIAYNKSFLLPSGKAGGYSSNYQKAIGMGALGADLGIAAAYNQPQDALEYLTQISKLATDLGISSAFDPEFSKQLLSNISKPDTFNMMLDKAFDKAEKNLRSNQRVATTVMLVTGGWVESVFISIEGLNTNPTGANTKDIYKNISAHCSAFTYIYQLLEAYKSNADCAKLLQEMQPMKTIFASYARPGWNADGLPALREKVSALRNKITS